MPGTLTCRLTPLAVLRRENNIPNQEPHTGAISGSLNQLNKSQALLFGEEAGPACLPILSLGKPGPPYLEPSQAQPSCLVPTNFFYLLQQAGTDTLPLQQGEQGQSRILGAKHGILVALLRSSVACRLRTELPRTPIAVPHHRRRVIASWPDSTPSICRRRSSTLIRPSHHTTCCPPPALFCPARTRPRRATPQTELCAYEKLPELSL